MSLFLRWFLVSTTFCVLLAALFLRLDQIGFFNIEAVEVMIENHDPQALYSQKALQRAHNSVNFLVGQPLYGVDLKNLQTHLKSEKWIRSFRIARVWPAKLEVSIQPQRVYFSILNPQGQITPIIETGELLEPVRVSQSPDVPLTRQIEFLKNPELRLKAIQLLKDVPLSGAFSRALISEIEFDKKSGFVLTMSRNNITVKLGEKNVRTKSLQVSQVMNYLENKKFQARVIDANLSQKVLVRLRKDP